MRCATLLAVALGLLACAPTAHAEPVQGLAWTWEADQVRRFHVRTSLDLPRPLLMNAERNTETMVSQLTATFVLSCGMEEPVGKRAWELRCEVDDASLIATPWPTSVGRVQGVLDEWDAKFEAATFTVVLGKDGHIRNVGITGVEERLSRLRAIAETMRLIGVRALAGGDLLLPRRGNDMGYGVWTQRESLAFGYVTSQGTGGGVEIVHQIRGVRDGVVSIASGGRGVIGGASYGGGQNSSADMFAMDYAASALFDTKTGTLLESQFISEGTPTASSAIAEGRAGASYVQQVIFQLLPEGEPAPRLGPNLEVELIDASGKLFPGSLP